MAAQNIIQGWQVADKRGKRQNRIPPFAPSVNELAVYEKYLNQVVQDKTIPHKTLVLGATPETRDHSIAAGLETWSVDISPQMMEKFSNLMDYQGHPLDKQIIGNWLELDYEPGSFGIIVADGSLNNLATQEHNAKVVQNCSRLLNQNGYMIDRYLTWRSHEPYTDALQIISDYRQGKLSWEDFFLELRITFYEKECFNPQTFQFDAGKCFGIIDQLLKDDHLTQEEYDRINTFRNNVINTFYPEKEYLKLMKEAGFQLVEKFSDKEFNFYSYWPLFIFRKG